ncbi:hypothetical protein T01_5806 [Trichinella spiralis]|uniref:Uncharacterized protein n=1 Tax=Trichinella spiralis TaxID=6334 RepID=A0A0V1BD10_TRISP|nr:hypothetical protein T01_5806 [Trichinella spiralis]
MTMVRLEYVQNFDTLKINSHQKKKLKNKLDHFITIKCFTMSKKWEYHVVRMPFCCCISEANAHDIRQICLFCCDFMPFHYFIQCQSCFISMLMRNCIDSVLLLLCCLLYELNLFNDLLNLI